MVMFGTKWPSWRGRKHMKAGGKELVCPAVGRDVWTAAASVQQAACGLTTHHDVQVQPVCTQVHHTLALLCQPCKV